MTSHAQRLGLTLPPAELTENGACVGTDVQSFYPESADGKGASRTPKKVCRNCDVVDVCLAWALANDERGIWGGTTDRERNRMRRLAAQPLGATA